MKTLLPQVLFAIVLLYSSSFSQKATPDNKLYNHLTQLNREWFKKSPDLAQGDVPGDYNSLIQKHLEFVRSTLTTHPPKNITPKQHTNRIAALEILSNYSKTGKFPINTQFDHIHPVFIDEKGTACAVGHLMIETGYGDLAANIQANENYAYLREIETDGVLDWANEYGFTLEELAWIQPGYPPEVYWFALGAGINGGVHSMHYEPNSKYLYVGGAFAVNSVTWSSDNIAAWYNNSWHSVGGGINGTVYVIQEHEGMLYAGGEFTLAGATTVSNLAALTINGWEDVGGGVDGTVRTLISSGGKLFVGGDFQYASVLNSPFLAIWDGSNWSAPTEQLDGSVRALTEHNGNVILGGEFLTAGNQTLNHIAGYNQNGFYPLGNGLDATVNALCEFQGWVAAGGVCWTDSAEGRFCYATWNDTIWAHHDEIRETLYSEDFTDHRDVFINVLHPQGVNLIVGGKMVYLPLCCIYGENLVKFEYFPEIGQYNAEGLAYGMDGPVNAYAQAQSEGFVGGNFTQVANEPVDGIVKNGGPSASDPGMSLSQLKVYPNPAKAFAVIEWENAEVNALQLKVYGLDGSRVSPSVIIQQNKITIERSGLVSGMYIFSLLAENKEVASGKVLFLD